MGRPKKAIGRRPHKNFEKRRQLMCKNKIGRPTKKKPIKTKEVDTSTSLKYYFNESIFRHRLRHWKKCKVIFTYPLDGLMYHPVVLTN